MRSDKQPSIKYVASLIKLMDAQFRIPGTKIRFGLDPLIGLVPGLGDFAGFVVSACILVLLAKNGASGFVLARMSLNIILDSVLGSIPVIGDIFDFAFKANQRNLKLLEEHYVEGKHQGGAWKLVVPLLLFLLLVVTGLIWASYQFISWLIS